MPRLATPIPGERHLLGGGTDGKPVREVAAAKNAAMRAAGRRTTHPIEIRLSVRLRALDDAGGDCGNAGIGGHGKSCSGVLRLLIFIQSSIRSVACLGERAGHAPV